MRGESREFQVAQFFLQKSENNKGLQGPSIRISQSHLSSEFGLRHLELQAYKRSIGLTVRT